MSEVNNGNIMKTSGKLIEGMKKQFMHSAEEQLVSRRVLKA